jgi:hypothetical protein
MERAIKGEEPNLATAINRGQLRDYESSELIQYTFSNKMVFSIPIDQFAPCQVVGGVSGGRWRNGTKEGRYFRVVASGRH